MNKYFVSFPPTPLPLIGPQTKYCLKKRSCTLRILEVLFIFFCIYSSFLFQCLTRSVPEETPPVQAPPGRGSPCDRGRGAWQIKTIWVPPPLPTGHHHHHHQEHHHHHQTNTDHHTTLWPPSSPPPPPPPAGRAPPSHPTQLSMPLTWSVVTATSLQSLKS